MLKGLIAATYVRKSRTDDRAEPVETTLARHIQLLNEYAKKTGLVITHTYQEVVSGDTIVSRPQMMQLLQDVEDGKYDAVLCLDIDRLGRGGMRDQGLILDTFKYSDTLIVTPERTYDLNNEVDEQVTEFKTFLSRQEYKIIKARLKRGKNISIQNGAYVANEPFGYKKTVIDKMPSLEPYPEEAKYIRMIFDMYTKQHLGATTIAEALNNMGVKPHRCEAFSRSTVNRMIKNPVYIGKIAWGRVTRKRSPDGVITATHHPQDDWIYVDGLHEPLIDAATWEAAQTIRTQRHLPAYNKGQCENPLAGLIVCKKCGYRMQMQLCRGKWKYIRCVHKQCSGSASFREVEESVLDLLGKALERIESEASRSHDTSLVDAKIAAADKELQLLKKQRGSLMTLLERGIYSIDDYQSRSVAVTENIAAVEKHLAEYKSERGGILCENLLAQARAIRTVLDQYASADTKTKNILLKSVIERVDYSRAQGLDKDIDLNLVLRFDVK